MLRAIQEDEIPQWSQLAGRAFRFDPARAVERLQKGDYRYGYRDCYVWDDPERGVVAGLVSFERTLSLNGAELPASLIASVSVPPDQRRRGYATAMMRASLAQDRAQGRPLSLLFPYSIPFYNRLGYGIVSYPWLLELPLSEMMDFVEGRLVRRVSEDDLPAMRRLYERERRRRDGWLSRGDWAWRERVLDTSHQMDWPHRLEGVVVPGDGDEIDGYLTYTLAKDDDGDRSITVHEWVDDSTRDVAWRALAGFVVAQRAQADFVRYLAPQGFPLHHALRERNTFRHRRRTDFAFRDVLSLNAGMMGRIVHPENALRQRRYPGHVHGTCVVQVHDPQVPENEVPLHVAIAAGRATVEPAAGAVPTATADVRTWSELYAAAILPHDARRLGRLQADDDTLNFLAAALASDPWYIHRADWF